MIALDEGQDGGLHTGHVKMEECGASHSADKIPDGGDVQFESIKALKIQWGEEVIVMMYIRNAQFLHIRCER